MENRQTQKYFPVLRTLAYLCIIAVVLSSFYSRPKQNNRKVLSYIVLEHEWSASGLEKKVNNYITLGWEPLGGVSGSGTDGRKLKQAMVKYSTE